MPVQMSLKKYESEVRLVFDDIKTFLETINGLNAKIIKKYSFKDHIYKPGGVNKWNLEEKIMRIREWTDKSQILYTKMKIRRVKNLSFKQTLYPEGKIVLYEGAVQELDEILTDWNFEFWFLINKLEGTLYEIKAPIDFTFVIEKIEKLGYTAEFELWGEEIDIIVEKFQKIIKLLKIDDEKITYKPLAQIYYETVLKK